MATHVARNLLEQDHPDVLRDSLQWLAAEVMEAEVSELIGARRGEWNPGRATYRNGYRRRRWPTPLGDVVLAIPRLRRGRYLPGFLAPGKGAERTLLSVVEDAYVVGVGETALERSLSSVGVAVDDDRVAEIGERLATRVEAFLSRRLEGRHPYAWLQTEVTSTDGPGQGRPRHVVIARGLRESGRTEVLAIHAGDLPGSGSWDHVLHALVRRGLTGVELVVSAAHPGLERAIDSILGVRWQRCVVDFLADCLRRTPERDRPTVDALVRPVFGAPDAEAARRRLVQAVAALRPRVAEVAEMLETAEERVLAFYSFPREHWRALRSVDPLERLDAIREAAAT